MTAAGFIDDLITLRRSFAKYQRYRKLIVTLADSLAFVVHLDKSMFVRARSTECFGFVTDSQSMTISLTSLPRTVMPGSASGRISNCEITR